MKRILILLLLTLIIIYPASADSVLWSDIKSVGTDLVLSAPTEFTNCIISPDNGDGWDRCTAYIEVYNNGTKDIKKAEAIWKKGNIRNITYQYSKNTSSRITDGDLIKEYSNWSSSIPNLNIGETIVIKVLFEKESWTEAAFDFHVKHSKDDKETETILDPNVSACGTLSTAGATYTQTQSITSTTTCIVIGAASITLDGSIYTITYGTSGSSLTTARYGIDNTGAYDNLIIKNTKVSLGNSARSNARSFYSAGMTYSTLQDNMFTVNGAASSYGAFLSTSAIYGDSNYNTLIRNTFSNTGTATNNHGIVLLTANYNNLSGNIASTASATPSVGIYMTTNSTGNLINNNTVTAATGYGIMAYTGSSNNTISNNNVTGGTSYAYFIYTNANNNSLINNIGSVTSGYVVWLNNVNNNTVVGNRGTATTGRGIYLNPSNDNNVSDNTMSGSSGVLYFLHNSNRNELINNTALTVSGTGILLNQSSNNRVLNGSYSDNPFAGTSYYMNYLVDSTNTFSNTNWTERETYYATTASFFNYSNNYETTFLLTNVSVTGTSLRRILQNWTQDNITLSEFYPYSPFATTAYYRATGLLPSTTYDIYNNTVVDFQYTTDASGTLTTFLINHNNVSRTVSIVKHVETSPGNVTTVNTFFVTIFQDN